MRMYAAFRQHAENLRALRELRGLSFSSLASASAISEQELRDAEQGVFAFDLMVRLANFYKIDIDFLTSDAGLDVGGLGSIFSFRGSSAALYREDLPTINRVAQRARLFVSATDQGREGLKQRQQFEPQPLSGDQQGSAARQGYRLARHIRTVLGLGAAPLLNLGGLLTRNLGVLVNEEQLTDPNYQACAVLDQERSAAAILLSRISPEHRQGTLLRRVYLAHELCHLLFDVTDSGSITISTDSGRDDVKVGVEQRARAFAAELLIPRDGLIENLGEPCVRNANRAIDLVEQARKIFGAPWKVAVNHLYNMGYIDEASRFNLEGEQRWDSAPDWQTESSDRSMAIPAEPQTPPDLLAERVWGAAREVQEAITAMDEHAVDQLLRDVKQEMLHNKPSRARFAVTMGLDDALSEGRLSRASLILKRLDLSAIPPGAISGALVVTREAKAELLHARRDFFTRALNALRVHHGWPQDEIDALSRRLH